MFSVDPLKKEKKVVKKFTMNFKIMFLGIFIFIVFGFILIYMNSDVKYRKNLFKQLIYSSHTSINNEIVTEIPYINVSGEEIESINNEIYDNINKHLNNDMNFSFYEYFVIENILSLVVKYVEIDENNIPSFYYETYNINLSENRIIFNDELLNSYNLEEEDVVQVLETSFQNFYDDLLDKGFLEGNLCDFNCFLELREIDDYLEGISYFSDGESLYANRPFNIYSVFDEQEYFKEDDFIFKLT